MADPLVGLGMYAMYVAILAVAVDLARTRWPHLRSGPLDWLLGIVMRALFGSAGPPGAALMGWIRVVQDLVAPR